MLKVVDDALYSVLEARKKTTKDTVVKFKRAADALDDYEMKYYSEKTSMYRMSEAVVRDMSASTVLKRLKETSRVRKYVDLRLATYLYWFLAIEGRTDDDSQVSSPQVPSR